MIRPRFPALLGRLPRKVRCEPREHTCCLPGQGRAGLFWQRRGVARTSHHGSMRTL